MDEAIDLDGLLGPEPFAHLMDQTLDSLTACYKGGLWPARQIVRGAFEDRPPAWRVAAFGAAVRKGIHLVDMPAGLLGANLVDPEQLPTLRLKTEYIWFLFSQRAWQDIRRFVDRTDAHDRSELPSHTADIYFLAFVRSHTDRIIAGEDVDGFSRDAAGVLDLLASSWSQFPHRQKLYAAIVRHITGDIAGARADLAAWEGGPSIGPLEAARHVLAPGANRARRTPQHLSIRPVERGAATLVSMDRRYFDQFGHAAASRYAETNAVNALHFHCIGFDPAAEVEAWNLSIPIGITVDSRDISQLNANQRFGYFAGARYLYLPDYLAFYGAIHVCDVDGFVVRDIRSAVEDMADADVSLSSRAIDTGRRLTRMPWEAIAAGSLLVRSTPEGLMFAAAVAGYLEEALQRATEHGKPFWYADQNALFYSWFDLKDRVRFRRLQPPLFRQQNSWALFEELDDKLEFIKSHRP